MRVCFTAAVCLVATAIASGARSAPTAVSLRASTDPPYPSTPAALRESLTALFPPAPVEEQDFAEQLAKSIEAMVEVQKAAKDQRPERVRAFVRVLEQVSGSKPGSARIAFERDPFGEVATQIESDCCVLEFGKLIQLATFAQELGTGLVEEGRSDEAMALSAALCQVGRTISGLNTVDHSRHKVVEIAAYLAALRIEIAASERTGDADRSAAALRAQEAVMEYYDEIRRVVKERSR